MLSVVVLCLADGHGDLYTTIQFNQLFLLQPPCGAFEPPPPSLGPLELEPKGDGGGGVKGIPTSVSGVA